MKIIITAAGEGVRMRPLTLDTPKPLLKYRGKTNLDHLFDYLPKEIDEAIIVIKYLGEQIKKYCGSNFHGRKISYVDGSKEGNALGIFAAKDFFNQSERFAIAYGDEVFAGDEIERCLAHEYSWLCYEVADATKVGVVTLGKNGRIIEVIEKPTHPKSNLAADGFMVVNSDIFKYDLVRHSNGEYYFSDVVGKFLKDFSMMSVIASSGHTQLTTPADIDFLNSQI